uniref:Uncharacterized protein n=1 Tax=Solanum lycopersicum TaxID=4081 RepID=K4BYZ3_SOLLC
MGGDHCFLSGGNGRLVHAVAENVYYFFKNSAYHLLWRGQLFKGDMSCVDNSNCRGTLFLFYNYATVAGGPFLLVLVVGEAAQKL